MDFLNLFLFFALNSDRTLSKIINNNISEIGNHSHIKKERENKQRNNRNAIFIFRIYCLLSTLLFNCVETENKEKSKKKRNRKITKQ